MFRISFPKRRSLTVTGVADDSSTLEGIGHYLNHRVSFRAVLALRKAFVASAASDAVVFYPDGFAADEVQTFVRRLIGNATLSLIIIVSATPDRFLALAHSRASAHKFIVLSKPVWPWELFATIQSSLPGLRREDSRLC